MKKYMDWHKYGTVALLIGIIISACSDMKKQKALHLLGAFIIGAGIGVCTYSGHRLLDFGFKEDRA